VELETIVLERRGGVAHLTLNRPEGQNALTLQMGRDLLTAATSLADDPTVRAVLLTGAGARFCAGGDVKGFAEEGARAGHLIREITVPLHAAMSQLTRLDAPVVAAVHGSAAGAGMGLVLAADLVVAGESTKFVMAYTGIGLSPDGSSSWYLPRVVGLHRALELGLTNRVLGAAEALDWGIVNRVVPDDEVAVAGAAWATELAAGPTGAFGAVKRLMHGAFDRPLDAQLARESEEMARAGSSPDGVEGVRAFVGKRPPEFRGR